MSSGIYQIENKTNGHKYIGSAVNISKRWRYHLQSLRRGNHHSIYLQRAFNEYGENNFAFSLLLECSPEDLIKNEQRFIDSMNPVYNLCKVAGSPLGYKHTEETRRKVGLASAGNKFAQGHKHTQEWKRLNALRMIGNKHSLGVKQSEETRQKKSAANKGKHLGSKPWLGKKHTEETKKKMSATNKGKPKSEEARKHMSEARLRYFENKKAGQE